MTTGVSVRSRQRVGRPSTIVSAAVDGVDAVADRVVIVSSPAAGIDRVGARGRRSVVSFCSEPR